MRELKHDNIFLIGPMGAGKSSIGKQLAKTLNKNFFDTDEEIEKRTGVDICWVVDLEGEEGFCKREAEVINELTEKNNIVLATGGHSILNEANRARLLARGTIIFLDVSLDYQSGRTLNESRRPMLRVSNREEVLEKFYYQNKLLYESIADWRVLTDNRHIQTITADIMQWLNACHQ
jgi:shikimate kinase